MIPGVPIGDALDAARASAIERATEKSDYMQGRWGNEMFFCQETDDRWQYG